MKSYTIESYAKVNVGLQILNERPDGYHNINTVFQELDFYDIIELKKKDNGCEFQSNVKWLKNDSTNLCVLAFEKLSEQYDIGGVSINLVKKIPSGGGLGGGSSNAAAILKGLCHLYSIDPINEKMSKIAHTLGADVPFFLKGGLQIASGIGEQLVEINGSINGVYLLIIPEFKIDTKWAYKSFKKFLQRPKVEVNFAGLLERDKTPFKLFENDFESIVIPAYPEIAIIKEKLWSCKPKFVSLSGSGSTVFGIFDDEAGAKSAESLFSHKYSTFIANPVTHMLK
jgi:4-diphosphocytidyl-2-C-methyl-D-erythritol kinase|tara:strand:+ start:1493 stop:2344 length:852 start_codon:yes stop_codon:yes gene_type:complete